MLFRNWILISFNDWDVCHTFSIQQFLYFMYIKSLIFKNIKFGKTVFESTVANRIHNVRESRLVAIPVCRQINVIGISSAFETQKFSIVLDFWSKVKCSRTVDYTSSEHNSFCIADTSDELLQVFCAEL